MTPTLFFVHGLGCGREDWTAQLEALSADHRCIAIDLPGHGASPAPNVANIESLAAAVNEAKLQSNGHEFVIIGHSLGAKVIREAYLQLSQDIVGLVFVDANVYSGDTADLVRKTQALIDLAGFSLFTERLFADMFLEGSDPQLRKSLLARAQGLSSELGKALMLASIRWDAARGEETLRRIAVPTLVLQATHFDSQLKRVPMQAGMSTPFMELVRHLVPQSQAMLIPGSGHFPMIDQPDAVNRHLLDFLTHIQRSHRR
jgi:pimeloyl-ACP methyl ester carboxylesterase